MGFVLFPVFYSSWLFWGVCFDESYLDSILIAFILEASILKTPTRTFILILSRWLLASIEYTLHWAECRIVKDLLDGPVLWIW